MSTDPQKKDTVENEVDLALISKKIGNAFDNFNRHIFNFLQFFIRKAIILLILLFVGIALGFYLDKVNKLYDHKIIIAPNFDSADYVYSKITLLNAKIRERDTIFLKSLGIPFPKKLTKIEIKPIVDIYQFINRNEKQNLELLKLMAEDGDINKIVEENATSKNYSYHQISLRTSNILRNRQTVDAILNYLNKNDYYKEILKQYNVNLIEKMKANELTIAQINAFLDGFSGTLTSGTKNSSLVYYNENTQLNDVINTKDKLVLEQGRLRINQINIKKIVKDTSATINIENKDSVNGKQKILLPFLFIALYIFAYWIVQFYKTRSAKYHTNQ